MPRQRFQDKVHPLSGRTGSITVVLNISTAWDIDSGLQCHVYTQINTRQVQIQITKNISINYSIQWLKKLT